MSLQALREQRNSLVTEMRALMDKPADKWDAAVDGPKWDELDAAVAAMDEQIVRHNRMNALTAERFEREQVAHVADRVAKDQKSEASKIFAKWLRGGDAALSAEDWAKYRATMSTTTTTQGGYTVQTDVSSDLIDALKAFGGMRAVANVIRTAQGNTINFPSSDGTSETGEIIGQNTTATGLDPSFGVVPLNVYKFSSKIVAVPFELLQDSEIDIEAFVRRRLATRLGRITNTKYTVGLGDGSSEPNGVITASATGVTAANSTSQVTAIVYDSIIDLEHSVDPAYRALGNCKFMMNDASVKVIRKIKDGQSRPLFVPGYETGVPGGAPNTLAGYPIQVNQDVAVMAANAKSLAFGDFSFFTIRDVMEMTMFRFTDSAYTKLGQVGFLAWMRSGSNLLDTGAVKLFVNAAT